MSLIIGKYFSGDPRQKPDQWGPAADVQAAIRENAAGMGIPAPTSAILTWEGVGKKLYDYTQNMFGQVQNNGGFSKNKLNFDYTTTASLSGYVDFGVTCNLPANFTILCRFYENSYQTYAGLIGAGGYSHGWSIYHYAEKSWRVILGVGYNLTFSDVPNVSNGRLQNLFITKSGTAVDLWQNEDGTATAIGPSGAISGDSNYRIGVRSSNTTNIPEYAFDGGLDTYFLFPEALPENKKGELYDNPYALIQPITRRFYSIPGGEIAVISAACTDGFTFADSATKTAILQAAAVESINLSDSDENVAQFIAALVDSFAMVDLSGNTAKYPVSVSDAFSVSDSTTALQKVIALVSDNVTFSDVSVVRADLTGIAEDNVQFSETLLAALQAQAIVTEIINLSDITTSRADLTTQVSDEFALSAVTTADVLGVLTGLCSDTFNVSDAVTSRADLLSAITDALGLSDIASALLTTHAQATDSFSLDDSSTWASIASALVADGFVITGEVTCRADLVAVLVDSMNLSDASATILTAYATATDGFTVSDTAFWAGITQAIASDSFTVSGSVTGLIKLLAQAAETINFSDSGSVTATYNVQVNDAVEFATAISTIAQFRAAVADGFNVTATPMEVSRLPNGKVSVSFSMKTATVVFNIK